MGPARKVGVLQKKFLWQDLLSSIVVEVFKNSVTSDEIYTITFQKDQIKDDTTNITRGGRSSISNMWYC